MVYENFLEHQSDYICFMFALSFFLLAYVCYFSGRHTVQRLPWRPLGLFGALYGTEELLEIAAYTLGDSTPLSVVGLLALSASFVCLLEFGLSGVFGREGSKKFRFIPPLLVALSFAGVGSGLDGLDVSVRYILGLPAGLLASAAFFQGARAHRDGGRGLVPAGVFMALYALIAGLVVPAAPFFPASVVNYATFLKACAMPVQFVKLPLVLSMTVSLIFYCRAIERTGEKAAMPETRPQCSFRPFIMVIVIAGLGWLTTEAAGRHVDNEASGNLLSRALTAAASILPERVASLTGTPADEGTPEFEHLRDDLKRIKAVNPDCRFVYLMGMKDGKEIFLVDAEPKGSKDYSRPGDIYPDATPEELADYKKGVPKVYAPYTDSWGNWVSGVAFIRNPATGEVSALFGMDIDANRWLHTGDLSRFFCMVITFVVSVLSMVLFAAWQRVREAAEQSAALRLANLRLADEKKLRDVTNAIGEGVMVQGADGVVGFANPEAERLLGWDRGELNGKTIAEAIGCQYKSPGVVGASRPAVDPAALKDAPHSAEDVYFTRRDGTLLAVSFVSSPIFEDGVFTGTVVSFQDITERKDIERQKNDFYAMVTHDLKSPLSVIQGSADLLLHINKDAVDPDTITLLKNVRLSSKRMLQMVNDFLTVSRLEFGKLSLNEKLEDITGMFSELPDEFEQPLGQKGITLNIRVPDNLPRMVCDRVQVHRAVTNLVQNAVHYTNSGGTVSVTAENAVDEGKELVVVSVSDNGPGIPVEDREKVFEKYYRSARTSGLKGSGLGLAIVKAVATAHGGRVELESSEGNGSTFRLFIPTKVNG